MDTYPGYRRSRRERWRRSGLLSAPVVFVWLLLSAPSASIAAPAPREFQVSPVKLEIAAERGEVETRTVQVVNHGTTPIAIDVSVKDYHVEPDNSFVFSSPGHESYSAANWVRVEESVLQLSPGEARECTLVIDVPRSAEPGGHYACALFSSAGDDPDFTGLRIDGRVGAVLLITVDGGTRRDGEILRFGIRKGILSRQVQAESFFENSGNVHMTAIQDVTFRNMFGRNVGASSCNPLTILPGGKQYVRNTWTAPLFGRFTASAVIRYGPDMTTYDQQRRSREVAFWVVTPEALLVAVGTLLLAAAFLAMDLRERRLHRLREAADEDRDDER